IPRYLSFGSRFPIQGKGFGNQGAVSLPAGGVGEACWSAASARSLEPRFALPQSLSREAG
ncbi:hypothetical protein N9Z79_09520, partial [Akkermansiaceae bacterium]|nr:hypothetical protein [Akkermansiaceae bacterium]